MAADARRGARTVLVVGATSGIGLAVAERLSARGDQLVLVARSEERLHEVAASLPGPAVVAPADVTDEAAVRRAVDAAVTTFGRLDGAVTTAQSMAYGSVEELPADVLQRLVDVGVAGTGNVARAVLPRFREAGGGGLVVVGSLLAEVAVPSMGGYCAAKWGQLGLVRALQMELRSERDVHVSLVKPGAVDTPIYRQAATFAGRKGSAPPPVVSPDRVAAACVDRLDRPRRSQHVGPANLLTVAGFRLLPFVYDRIVGPLVDQAVLRGPRTADDDGNVFHAVPEAEDLRGGWTTTGRFRDPLTGKAHWRG